MRGQPRDPRDRGGLLLGYGVAMTHRAAIAVPFGPDQAPFSAATDSPSGPTPPAYTASEAVGFDVRAQHASDATKWRRNAGTVSDATWWAYATKASYCSWGIE